MEHSPGFLKLVDAAKARIRQIDAADLPDALSADPNALLIDTREDFEWEAGHVDGAMHLSKGIIERDIEHRVPDADTTLYLYCGGGYRSALVADALQQMGYRNPVSVDGGWRELKEFMPVAVPGE